MGLLCWSAPLSVELKRTELVKKNSPMISRNNVYIVKNNANCKIVIAYRKVDWWKRIEHTKGNTCMGTPPTTKGETEFHM